MGIPEPLPTAPQLEPDILLVPLLAFDKNRNRLGYGGGFYDRTIAYLRQFQPLMAVGIAYSFQEVENVPTGTHDIALDQVVTEVNVF
jgi:5-formyltetrahydrofolate cyclo-ligase